MKKMNRKMLALALAAALMTSLASCGSGNAAQASASAQTAADTRPVTASSEAPAEPEAAGTLLLALNPEIEMEYDHSGNVLALDGRNADGDSVLSGYTGYAGRPCDAVAGELVARMDAGGYFDGLIDGHERNIVLKMARGSA